MDPHDSISVAEVQTIKMAINKIVQDNIKNVIICSDSQSTLTSLMGQEEPKENSETDIMGIREDPYKVKDMGIQIVLVWSPAHKGIEENELTDRLAKSTEEVNATNVIANVEAKHLNENFKQNLSKDTIEGMRSYNKGKSYFELTEKFSVKPWFQGLGLGREQITIINRLKSGHTHERAHIFRMNILVEEAFECGELLQTTEHLL